MSYYLLRRGRITTPIAPVTDPFVIGIIGRDGGSVAVASEADSDAEIIGIEIIAVDRDGGLVTRDITAEGSSDTDVSAEGSGDVHIDGKGTDDINVGGSAGDKNQDADIPPDG